MSSSHVENVADKKLCSAPCSSEIEEGEDSEDDDVFENAIKTNQYLCKHMVPIDCGNNNNVDPYSASPENPTVVTLLEKLVRSHPIWYLPHMGRIAVVHLLRTKEPGIFIVRHSSQPNSMAVSIKLSPNSVQEVEHYLIETTIAGVHLEGSPNFFSALPILLTHYCESSDELPLKLKLPAAIINCESRRDLCSLSLLGQDFWSSEHCCQVSSSQLSLHKMVTNESASAVEYAQDALLFGVTTNAQQNAKSCLNEEEVVPPLPLLPPHQAQLFNNSPSTKHRRSLSMSNYPTANNDVIGLEDDNDNALLRDVSVNTFNTKENMKFTKSNFTKNKQRSESVCDSSKNSAQNESEKKFSWKSLFDGASRKTSFQQNQQKSSPEPTTVWYQELKTPHAPVVESSRLVGNNFVEPTYFAPNIVQVENKSVTNLLQTDESVFDTPTMSRKRLLTFKPGSTAELNSAEQTYRHDVAPDSVNSSSLERNQQQKFVRRCVNGSISVNELSSVDRDVAKPTLPNKPKPPVKMRLGLLRREVSDLGCQPSSIAATRDVDFGSSTLSRAVSKARNIILPPDNRDPSSFKSCVDELRQRRIEAARNSTSNNNNKNKLTVQSRRDGSPHFLNRENSIDSKTRKIAELLQLRKSDTPTSVLRNRPGGAAVGESTHRTNMQIHRLSAPNLAADNGGQIISVEQRTVTEMLKELKFRQQKFVPATVPSAGLDTINEGLTVAVSAKSSTQGANRLERRLSQSMEDVSSMPYIDNDEEPTLVLEDRKFSGKPEVQQRLCRSHTVHNGFSNASQNLADLENHDKQQRLQQSRKDENKFHNETNFQWVSVTNEIKNRQKVAKVVPVLNPNCRLSNSSSNGGGSRRTSSTTTTTGGGQRQKSLESEYAMLHECSELFSDDCGRYGSIGGASVAALDAAVVSPFEREDSEDAKSVISTAGTVFSEPWDSSVWENLLQLVTVVDNKESSTSARSSSQSKKDDVIVSPSQQQDDLAAESKTTSFRHNGAGVVFGYHGNSNHVGGSRPTPMAERLRKLKENNIPPPLAPTWEEFSSHIPMSSGVSTANNSLEKPVRGRPAPQAPENKIPTRTSSCNSEEDKFTLGPVMSPARFREGKFKFRALADPSLKIQHCVDRLAKDVTNFFGAQVQYFIKCTIEGQETDPNLVVGNVRQFMNGIKNYLVKHGEHDLHNLIEQERSKLQYTEFLNIDAILEGVLQKIILHPLKPHLYQILIQDSSRNGSLQLLSENVKIVRHKSAEELGIKSNNCDTIIMERVRHFLRKMQSQYSPLKKLENLLRAVSMAYSRQSQIVKTISFNSSNLPAADELLKWFVYLVSRCSMVGCEIEAVYMWGLLHPALLSGEASYYLTAFSSAIHVLKHIDLLPKLQDTASMSSDINEIPDGFLKVAIPNEISGAIKYLSFPAVPQMNAQKFCRMIAHKCGITNSEDYGLYLLVDGYETCLLPSECPELVKEQLKMADKPHMFAYKRTEAKIAWPKVAHSPIM